MSNSPANRIPPLPVLGWATFAGQKHASLPAILDLDHWRYTSSGRAGIGLACELMGLRPGDRVWVPTYHCPTMIEPIARTGAEPVFYPIDSSGAPQPEWLRRMDLSAARAILIAHYFGLPQSLSRVRSLCDAQGVRLIEDCAHSFFGVAGERPIGTWGDIAIASLTKFFPVTHGGVIASNVYDLDRLVLHSPGWTAEIKAVADALELAAAYRRFCGLNTALRVLFTAKKRLRRTRAQQDNASPAERALDRRRPATAVSFIAASACRARIVELRRRNYRQLAIELANLSGGRALHPELPAGTAPYVFPLYVDDPQKSYQKLRAAGVPIFRWDAVWPGTPSLEGDRGSDWATHVFQLGCHQDLTLEDMQRIAQTARALIETRT